MQNAPNSEPTKTCKTCASTLPTSEFARNSKGKLGVASRCKSCEAAAARLRRALSNDGSSKRPPKKTAEEESAYLRQWRAANPGKVAEYRHKRKQVERDIKLRALAYDIPAPTDVYLSAKKYQSRLNQSEWVKENRAKVHAHQRKHYYKDLERSRERCRSVAAKCRSNRYAELYSRSLLHKANRRWRKPLWVSWGELYEVRRLAQRLTLETGEPHEVDHIYPLQSEHVCGLDTPLNLRVVTRTENRSKKNRLLLSLQHEHGVTDVSQLYVDI